MSNTVGYVLLGASVVPGFAGWDLSRRGLAKVSEATDQAKQVAKATKDVVEEAHTAIAQAPPGAEASTAAAKTTEVVGKTNDLTAGISDVSEALNEMTGVFAPARVFLALMLLLVLASFVALDVITLGT